VKELAIKKVYLSSKDIPYVEGQSGKKAA